MPTRLPATLSERDRLFAEHFVQCGFAAEAMRRVDPEVLFPAQQGARLLRREDVRAYVAELRAQARLDAIASHTEVCEAMTRLLRANLRDFVDADGELLPGALDDPEAGLAVECIEASERSDREGNRTVTRRIRLPDRIRAAERLARLRGYDSAERVEHTGEVRLWGLPPLAGAASKEGSLG